jgi:sugar lactone lactonase YvrE
MHRFVIKAVLVIALLLPGVVRSEGLFNKPEGTTYDPVGDRWFVSNYGDGAIVQIDKQGEQTYFSTYATTALGLHIVGNTLYVASPEGEKAGLLGFNLETGSLVVQLPFVGMNMPNDLESDTSGFLYVTDWRANRILKVRLSDYTYSVFVPSIPLPNGIVFDRRLNRLLVCCEGEGQARIMAVSLADSSVTVVAHAGTGDCDGLAVDGNGYYYFSSWNTGSVFQYDPLFLIRKLISGGHSAPASIYFDSLNNVLAIPALNENRVKFLSLPDSDGDSYLDINDNCPGEPNPDQVDSDQDWVGDQCDDCTDTDGDGYGNPGFPANTCEVDYCPDLYTVTNEDTDSDGIGDDCDNCPDVANPGQEDVNQNLIGDVCEGCCVGRVGDANGAGGDEPTIGDISTMIDALFISGNPGVIPCLAEGDVNQSGAINPAATDITISDISALIDYLFITGPSRGLPACL